MEIPRRIKAIRGAFFKVADLFTRIKHPAARARVWLLGLVVMLRTGIHPKVARLLEQGAATQSELRMDQQSIVTRLTAQDKRIEIAETALNTLQQRFDQLPEHIRAIVREATALRQHVTPMFSSEYQLNPGRSDAITLPVVTLTGLINPKIITELDVVGGANNDLKLYLTDPHGRRIDDFGQTYSGRFETPVQVGGTYSLHLDNTMSWVSTKFGFVKVSLVYETLGSG
jgi:hypothetical protein